MFGTRKWLGERLFEDSACGKLIQVRILLERKAPINLQDYQGTTALMLATRNGHLEVIRELINNGADIKIRNHRGDTAMYVAIRSKNVNAVRVFVQDGINEEITVPRHCRWLNRDIDYLNPVSGPNTNRSFINFQDEYGNTALMFASGYNELEIVKVLLQVGSDIDIKNNNGQTAYDITESNKIKKLIIRYKNYRENVRQSEEIDNLRKDMTSFFNIIPKDIHDLIKNRFKNDKP